MYFTPWDDRRRALRLKASLPLHYEALAEAKSADTLTQDISEGGLRIISDSYIPRLTKFVVRLKLTPHKLLAVNAEVKWSERIRHSYRYQAGLEFKDIGPDTRRGILEYLAFNR